MKLFVQYIIAKDQGYKFESMRHYIFLYLKIESLCINQYLVSNESDRFLKSEEHLYVDPYILISLEYEVKPVYI